MSGMVLLVAMLIMAGGCGKKSNDSANDVASADRGRSIYLSNCAACHNPDPSKDGPVGPAIKGASRELIEARVLRATYPPGYTPKRRTSVMPAQPYLKSAIPHIAAFLADSAPPSS